MEIFGIIAVVLVIGVAYAMANSDGQDTEGSGEDVSMSGQTLSAGDIQNYAQNAGFTGDDLNIAVAVALAESSGSTQALGDPTKGVSVGLWQINLKAHPEYTQDQLLDPQTNANAAFAIYSARGNSFTPWTTYNTGAYEQFYTSGGGGSY